MTQDRYDWLILRMLSNKASPEQRHELEQWIRESPDHQHRFTEAKQVWTTAAPPEFERPVTLDEAWQEIESTLDLTTSTKRPVFRYRHVLAAAAILLVVFGSLFVFRWREDAPTRHEMATRNGQRLELSLPDGSKLQVNAATVVSYPSVFSDSIRLVILDGEAYFDVVQDGRPFVVQTAHTSVRVMGTAFNVWARDSQTRVIVKDGRVALRPVDDPKAPGVIVTAGQMSIHRAFNTLEPARIVDVDNLLSWLDGALMFDQTPLTELVDELQRFYDVPIVITDPALKTRPLTARFQDKSIEAVLDAICLALDAQYSREADIYRISTESGRQ